MSDMSKYIKKSDIKCPICQTLLDVSIMSDKVFGCPKCRNMGNVDLWQELIDSMKEHDLCHDALVERTKELDRTRKALELAITGLKNCKTREHIGAVCRTPEYVDKILEQINTITKGGDNE